jgi:CHAT domain-containing protein
VTGELGFLPIHAAGSYEGPSPVCTADYVVSSYIPTLSALTRARASWHPVIRTDLAGLLICEESFDNGSERHLPNAAREVAMVRESFEMAGARVLNAPSVHTSLADMRFLLEGTPAHILHVTCHGVQDADPLRSAFVLEDGKLTIEDIMGLQLPPAILAFLSACQTAKGDREAPDQAVHVAASMLFCGFRSVIGTMWCVHVVWAHPLLITSH